MKSDPHCLQSNVPSPLEGFHFTRDWLAGENLPHRHLPSPEIMISQRTTELDRGCWKPFTAEEVEALARFNNAAGNIGGASLAAELARPDALVVVTGQQPDLLAAPLYVLHKALSAIAWAKKLSLEQGRPVIPVFWVASDDDDFVELKQSWHVGFDGAFVDIGRTVSRGKNRETGSPAFTWDLTESSARLEAQLGSIFQGWTDGSSIAEWLSAEIGADSNFETLFCRLLSSLLGPANPMLFIAPRLLPFRQRQVELLQADLKLHHDLNTRISHVAEEFEAAGYPVTLFREPEALNFFWLHNGVRHRLVRRDGGIVALAPQRNTVIWQKSTEDLHALIAATPDEFAPNVVTRPVLQDMSLPTLAYIAGPGELAYLALLGEAYQVFGKSRAAVIPRTLVTMVPTDSVRRATCFRHPSEAPAAVLEQGGQLAEELLARIASLLEATTTQISDMKAIAKGTGPEVDVALDKTDRHIRKGVEQLKRRLAKQVATAEWSRASRLASLVAPAGSSQERMLSPWNFVKAGEWDALARHLVSLVDYTAQQPQTVALPDWIEAEL